MNIERQAIELWSKEARRAGIIGPTGFDAAAAGAANEAAAQLLYPRSLKQADGAVFALLKMPGISRNRPAFAWDRALGIFGPSEAFAGFEGEVVEIEGGSSALLAALSHANALSLRRALPFTAPSPFPCSRPRAPAR